MGLKKTLISIWLIFHLFIIIMFPNSFSFIHKRFEGVMYPYANALGVGSTWNLYSPDPESTRYLEYEVERSSPEFQNMPTLSLRWAPDPEGFFDFQWIRKHTNMGFLYISKGLIDKTLIPWVCRTTPHAKSVTVKMVAIRIPAIEEVQQGYPIFNENDSVSERITSGSCP